MRTAMIGGVVSCAFALMAASTGNWVIGFSAHPQTLFVYHLYWPASLLTIYLFLFSLIRVFRDRHYLLPMVLCLPMLAYFCYHPTYRINKREAAADYARDHASPR
jgi:hypothetical protein